MDGSVDFPFVIQWNACIRLVLHGIHDMLQGDANGTKYAICACHPPQDSSSSDRVCVLVQVFILP